MACLESLTGRMIKKYDEETSDLLTVLLNMIEAWKGKKASEKFRKDVLGIVFKMILLYKQKQLNKETFNTFKYSFRFICSSMTNAYRNYSGQLDEKTLQRIKTYIDKFKNDLTTIAEAHDKKLAQKIESTVSFVGNVEFLTFASKSPTFKAVIFVLMSYLARTA
eukprot:TRINITY_DN4609_c0_g2_i1.p1 TRINITY_DN4609_c0_g2~~TRINITY_DN4609_c0_g2_i1.p1  ORF type:complete len:164 (+),score=17.46 TRINITY_DN4609_c0_g2_i1:84-575(+)